MKKRNEIQSLMKNMTKLGIGIFALLIIIACQKEPTNDMLGEPKTFKEVVDLGGGFSTPTLRTETTSTTSVDSLINGERMICTVETKDIMGEAGGKSGFPLFSPNAGIIFPGGLLQGNSLGQASPNPIGVKRAGGTISTDILDGNEFSSITVDEVGKGSVTQAINDIIASGSGIVPANFTFDYNSIQSKEEFAMELGVDVETAFVEIEGNLKLKFESEVNRYYVRLEQSFYTMSFDMPTSYDEVFSPAVTPEDLAKYVQPGNPACYISDVTYGRIFYMVIESSSSKSEMDAAISGSYNGVGVEVDANLAIEKMSELENLKISIFAFGGETESTFDAIGQTNIEDLKTVLGKAADIRSGKALSYVVKSVYNNQVVATQLATKYDIVNCLPAEDADTPLISRHWGGLSSEFGIIGAAFELEEEVYLFNNDGNQFMKSRIGELEGPFPIEELCANGSFPFDGLGAASWYRDESIIVFDMTGSRYTYISPGKTWNGTIYNISVMYDGECPFNSIGIGAAGNTLYGQFNLHNPKGDLMTRYSTTHNSWLGPWDSEEFTLLPEMGGCLGILDGNSFFLYFDKANPQYTVYGNLDGTEWTTTGPFSY